MIDAAREALAVHRATLTDVVYQLDLLDPAGMSLAEVKAELSRVARTSWSPEKKAEAERGLLRRQAELEREVRP